jgi:NitT/TauT family transport system substrate-binding protein
VVDIAVVNDSAKVPKLIASKTGADVIIVATLLRQSPQILLGLDKSLEPMVPSAVPVTPQDLLGASIGVQVNAEYVVSALLARCGLDSTDVKIMRVGNGPEPLIAGRIDFMTGWIVNQPRLLEDNGYRNWRVMLLQDFLWTEYSDTSVVTRETARKRPSVVRRYLWALWRATGFMLDHPGESAELTRRYATQADLSIDQILRRFELQRPLIVRESRNDLLRVDADVMDTVAAHLLQNGIIEL